jgi:hypothetical protein
MLVIVKKIIIKFNYFFSLLTNIIPKPMNHRGHNYFNRGGLFLTSGIDL